MTPGSVERVERLLVAARRIADRNDPIGQRARSELPYATGLSRQGVELALERCLETHPSRAELEALTRSVEAAPAAHVLLSANVFVAAHRAIALALVASEHVVVRPSRREPVMATLLEQASGGAFELRQELRPAAGEHVFAYASDDTIIELRRSLPRGVVLYAHGAGLGVAIVEQGEACLATARALADDVVLFDQRGCLSPRVAIVLADVEGTRRFARDLASSLDELGASVPRGVLDEAELADERRYRDSVTYAAELFTAQSASVCFDISGERLLVPPIGRNVCVLRAASLSRLLSPMKSAIAAASASNATLEERLRELLPNARVSKIGRMQRPPFDGPVDHRTRPELLE